MTHISDEPALGPTKAGRFEEMGHDVCRWFVRLLTEDADVLSTPTGVGYAMVAVAVAWGLASPAIYCGRLLDGLLGHDPDAVDGSTFSFEQEPAAADEPDPEDLTVVVDI